MHEPTPPISKPLYDELLSYVNKRVNSRADAEDLVQQVLLAVVSKQPPSGELFAPWVFRVAKNAIIDTYRGRERSRRRQYEASALDLEGGCATDQNVAQELRRLTETEAIASYVRQLVETLGESDQQALISVELEGRSQKMYADSQGLTYVTAKSRVQRARQRLRAELERHCDLALDGRGVPIGCVPKTATCCSDTPSKPTITQAELQADVSRPTFPDAGADSCSIPIGYTGTRTSSTA